MLRTRATESKKAARRKTRLVCTATAAFLSMAGCALDEGGSQPDEIGKQEHESRARDDAPTNNVEIERVTPNGTGCPAGSYDVSFSEDKQTFEVKFKSYKAEAAAGSSFSIKDCTLVIGLKTKTPHQYAVASTFQSGHAQLGSGAKATLTAMAYVQGNPSNASNWSTDIVGPYSGAYDVKGHPDGKEVWSPCGVQRDLVVQTRVRLSNGESASSSSISVEEIGGSLPGATTYKPGLAITARACTEGGATPPSGEQGPSVTPPTDGPTVEEVDRTTPPTPPSGGPRVVDVDRTNTPTPPSGGPRVVDVDRAPSGSSGGPSVIGVDRSSGGSSSSGPSVVRTTPSAGASGGPSVERSATSGSSSAPAVERSATTGSSSGPSVDRSVTSSSSGPGVVRTQ